MGLPSNTSNGPVCKLEISKGQIICLWRFVLNSITQLAILCSTPAYVFIFQVCKIVEGQRYSKRLNERQITALLKVTCQRPQDREHDILKVCLFAISP